MALECGEIDESDYRADFGICNRCNRRFRLGQVCPNCRNPEFRLIPKKRAAAKIAARKRKAMASEYGHRDRKRTQRVVIAMLRHEDLLIPFFPSSVDAPPFCPDCDNPIIIGREAIGCRLCGEVVCDLCRLKHRCLCAECGDGAAVSYCTLCETLLCEDCEEQKCPVNAADDDVFDFDDNDDDCCRPCCDIDEEHWVTGIEFAPCEFDFW